MRALHHQYVILSTVLTGLTTRTGTVLRRLQQQKAMISNTTNPPTDGPTVRPRLLGPVLVEDEVSRLDNCRKQSVVPPATMNIGLAVDRSVEILALFSETDSPTVAPVSYGTLRVIPFRVIPVTSIVAF